MVVISVAVSPADDLRPPQAGNSPRRFQEPAVDSTATEVELSETTVEVEGSVEYTLEDDDSRAGTSGDSTIFLLSPEMNCHQVRLGSVQGWVPIGHRNSFNCSCLMASCLISAGILIEARRVSMTLNEVVTEANVVLVLGFGGSHGSSTKSANLLANRSSQLSSMVSGAVPASVLTIAVPGVLGGVENGVEMGVALGAGDCTVVDDLDVLSVPIFCLDTLETVEICLGSGDSHASSTKPAKLLANLSHQPRLEVSGATLASVRVFSEIKVSEAVGIEVGTVVEPVVDS
jgi:hypothetical protein